MLVLGNRVRLDDEEIRILSEYTGTAASDVAAIATVSAYNEWINSERESFLAMGTVAGQEIANVFAALLINEGRPVQIKSVMNFLGEDESGETDCQCSAIPSIERLNLSEKDIEVLEALAGERVVPRTKADLEAFVVSMSSVNHPSPEEKLLLEAVKGILEKTG